MRQQQRLNMLLDLVSERGHVSVTEVQEALGVSAATARRDISRLAEQRLVTRTHGGATVLGSAYELPLQYKIARHGDAKLAIARAAAELVPVGSTVALNGGTTTTEVARTLGRRPDLDAEGSITVVTNALNIAYELSIRRNVTLVVTGGTARSQSYELVGPLGEDVLSKIVVDTAILGVDGLSGQAGLTTIHPAEAKVGAAFADVAARVMVVADSSKMGVATFAKICELSKADVLVTEKAVEGPLADDLAAAGVEVVVGEP